MNKSTKKMVNRLSRYIGKEVIRTGSTKPTGDRSLSDTPIIIKGFTSDGEIICTYSVDSFEYHMFGSKDFILPLEFTDDKWKLYSKIFKPKNSDLNQYIGKEIKRVHPVIYSNLKSDFSYTDMSVKLISATKYHLVVECYSDIFVLPFDFAKPEDWILAE